MRPREEGLDEDLVARAAAAADSRGETVEDVIERALRAYLAPPAEVASQVE
jgi:hypothetical protein